MKCIWLFSWIWLALVGGSKAKSDLGQKLPAAREGLITMLKSERRQYRLNASELLVQDDDESKLKLKARVLTMLNDTSMEVKIKAVDFLVSIKDQEIEDALTKMLGGLQLEKFPHKRRLHFHLVKVLRLKAEEAAAKK